MNATSQGMRVAMLGADYRFGFSPLGGDMEQPAGTDIADNPRVDTTAVLTTTIETLGRIGESAIESKYGRGDAVTNLYSNGTSGESKTPWYQDPAALTVAGVGVVVGLVVLNTAMKKSRRRR